MRRGWEPVLLGTAAAGVSISCEHIACTFWVWLGVACRSLHLHYTNSVNIHQHKQPTCCAAVATTRDTPALRATLRPRALAHVGSSWRHAARARVQLSSTQKSSAETQMQ